MPKETSDPPSYSVDEMMEKLREGEREKRERESSKLVTRPDGTQVVRVRRRKRRSDQPHKTQEVRRQRFGVVLVAVGVALAVALAVAGVLLVARFNSKGFREDLTRRAGAASGTRVAFADFSVTPIRARARTMRFEWPGHSALKNLVLHNVVAELKLNSMFGDTWNGEELLAESGTLTLGWPQAGVPPVPVTDDTFPFNYEQYRCPNFEIRWTGKGKKPAWRLIGSEVTLRRPVSGPMQILVNRGRIATEGWEDFLVDRGTILLNKRAVELSSLRIRPKKGGGEALLQSSGPILAGQRASLRVTMDDVPLQALLGPDLGRVVSGKVASEAGSIQFDPNQAGSLSTRIAFTGVEGRLRELVVLASLQTILRDSFFAKPSFGTLSGVYRRDSSGTRLEDLKFEQKSVMVVRGSLAVSPTQELSGRLLVGVSAGIMIPVTTGKKRWDAFTDPRDGYCWITVNLSGTLSEPKDDFGESLYRAAREKHPTGGSGDPLEETFERLTDP